MCELVGCRFVPSVVVDMQLSKVQEWMKCGPVLVLVLSQVLDVQQHGVLLCPHLVALQQVGHQLRAQSVYVLLKRISQATELLQ